MFVWNSRLDYVGFPFDIYMELVLRIATDFRLFSRFLYTFSVAETNHSGSGFFEC